MHHIPSKAVMREYGTVYSMPAIALLKDDHVKTDSYLQKSLKGYQSFIPDVKDKTSYITEAKERIKQDQFFELVRIELFNIIDQCGHRYDEAIKKYLSKLKDFLNNLCI